MSFRFLSVLIGAFLRPKFMKEGIYMNQGSKEKPARIELRVTAKEKDKIQSKA